MPRRRTLFERLTGSIRMDDDVLQEEPAEETLNDGPLDAPGGSIQSLEEEYEEDGELAIDMYQDGNNIVVKAMTAGVEKNNLDIAITRETVVIQGRRTQDSRVQNDQFYYQELYWGTFSRSVQLPDEIDVELAEASEEHGLLTIKLPLIDKHKQAKLKVA